MNISESLKDITSLKEISFKEAGHYFDDYYQKGSIDIEAFCDLICNLHDSVVEELAKSTPSHLTKEAVYILKALRQEYMNLEFVNGNLEIVMSDKDWCGYEDIGVSLHECLVEGFPKIEILFNEKFSR